MAKACKRRENKGARKRLGREGMRAGEGVGDGERVRARNGEDAGEARKMDGQRAQKERGSAGKETREKR